MCAFKIVSNEKANVAADKLAQDATTLTGAVPVIPTPFREDESIDWDALAACVDFAARVGVSAVCLPAYGSEFYKLSEAEREQVAETAIGAAAGRTLVIAQSNHPAAIHAAEIARGNEARGADLISFAMPRTFPLPEADLLSYCHTVCSAVKVPVLLQDFNPGGTTIGGDFCRRLLESCPNFRYAKLEEPLMATKVREVREATSDQVGVLEGWGGMYLIELIEPGICGFMPGLGMADLFQSIWRMAEAGLLSDAQDLYEKLLPQVVYSLQSMELFLQMEKDLLVRRGVIDASSAHVRSASWRPDKQAWRHAQILNERVADLGRELSKS
jgi:4-hydroxy-tetrahydrodipicolinate synthase